MSDEPQEPTVDIVVVDPFGPDLVERQIGAVGLDAYLAGWVDMMFGPSDTFDSQSPQDSTPTPPTD